MKKERQNWIVGMDIWGKCARLRYIGQLSNISQILDIIVSIDFIQYMTFMHHDKYVKSTKTSTFPLQKTQKQGLEMNERRIFLLTSFPPPTTVFFSNRTQNSLPIHCR